MKGQAPPPLPPSSPSQRLAPPVIEVQKSSQLFPVTPPKERSPVTSRLVLVALVERSTVDVSFERLVEVVAATRPSLSVDRTPFVIPVSHALPEKLASVVEELANDCKPVHVLLLASKVVEATEMELPLAKLVPLIVPRDPEINPDPIEVVATIEPSTLVDRSALARLVIAKDVEVACVSVALPLKVFTPVQVLVFARRVEDAAVTVIEAPRLKSVPLMVPREPEMSPEPIVVVDTTRPFESVARRALVSDVSQVEPVFVNCVVVARVLENKPTTVDEA